MSIHGQKPGYGVQFGHKPYVRQMGVQFWVMESNELRKFREVFLNNSAVVSQKEFVEVFINECREAGISHSLVVEVEIEKWSGERI